MAASAIPQVSVGTFPWKNVMDYGATGAGLTDDTAAIQAAITAAGSYGLVYMPSGTYLVNGELTMSQNQHLSGAGFGGETTIHVTTGAAQTDGLFYMPRYSKITDLLIKYDQPDNANYTGYTPNFTQYKPAFYTNSFPSGAWLENVQIQNAWDGIRMTGNSGRTTLRNVWMSMLNRGVDIDGALDTVRIESMHIWPFGMTTNQTTAFKLTGHSVALYCGRCDQLTVTDSMILSGTAMDVHAGSGTPPQLASIMLSNTHFDVSQVNWSGGSSGKFSNCFFAAAASLGLLVIQITDGHLQLENCRFRGFNTLGLMQLSGGNSSAQLSNCRFDAVYTNSIPLIAQSGGQLQVTNCHFIKVPNTVYTTPIIDVTAGRAVISNNYVTDQGTGTGDFVRITTDEQHVIDGNVHPGWTLNLPANPVLMRVYGNQSGTQSVLPYATQQTNITSPTGTTNNTTGVMMGLGATAKITPTASGIIHFAIAGMMSNSLANNSVQVVLYYGTVGAGVPANGAAPTGTALGQQQQAHVAIANGSAPFSLNGVATLTVGTQYWYDVRVLAGAGGGTASLAGVSANAFEIP